ncbi:MAG: OPT/YSL family transporter, partial [Saprospiraceae bacterium]|nr:OPT/YSL family transporter [Saprospiraceae bacterium]
GVFAGDLPWTMVWIGMGLAVLIILADKYQEARGSDFRIPVLAVAVGLYLPFELDSAIMLGGIIAWLVSQYQERNRLAKGEQFELAQQASNRNGLLFASGLITGEALIGIILAIPVAIAGRSDVMALLEDPLGSWPGVIVILLVAYWLYSIARRGFKGEE